MQEPASEPVMPVAFVSHGAPSLALDAERGRGLARWGAGLPRPRSILVVSAHWERTPLTVGTVERRPLLHDYHGFDPKLRDVEYPAPAAPELAQRLARDLGALERHAGRPWDHGVWVPLMHMFPAADVPVLQLSLPSRASGAELIALGRALAPLREERCLLLASGGMVHDLGGLDWSERSAPPAWALEFEAWARGVLEAGEVDALADAERRSPGLRRAHPTLEHWLPLLVAAGAAAERGLRPSYPVEGFEYGSLSKLSVQFV